MTMLESKRNNILIILALFLLAFILRVIHLNFSFSNDELSAIFRAFQPDFNELIQQGVKVDGHPAGVQIFLYYWIHLFGTSEWLIRLPFALFGSIAVVFAFLFAKRKLGLTPALLTAIALTSLEFSLIHSQIARPYSSGLMLAMMAIFFWDKIVFPKNNDRNYFLINSIVLSVLIAANAYNHYFSALFMFIMAVTGLFYIDRNLLIRYIAICTISVLLFIPHLNISLLQLSYGGVGEWLSVPKPQFIIHHIAFIFNNSWVLLIIVFGLVLTLIISQKEIQTKLWKTRFILFIWFLIPIIIGYLYSIYRNPILQDRVLIFTMPFLLMFIFSFVSEPKNKMQWAVVFAIGLSILVHTVGINKYYTTNHFIDFKGIAQEYKNTHSENTRNNILSLQHCNSKKYMQFYLQDSSAVFEMNEISNNEELMQLKTILHQNKTDFVEFLSTKPQNRIARMMIQSQYANLINEEIDQWNNGYYLYSKSESWPLLDSTAEFYQSTDSLNLNNQEYSPGLEISAGNSGSYFLQLQLLFLSDSANLETMVVFAKSKNGENTEWWSVPFKYFMNGVESPIIIKSNFTLDHDESAKIFLWNPKLENITILRYQSSIIPI